MIDSGNPVDLTLWTRSGAIESWHNCIGLRYSFRSGTHRIKLLDSRQIRTVRDVCIFQVNGLKVFL